MSKYEDFEFIKTIKNFNESNNNGCTHFHFICFDNPSNLEIIKYCVENGADFNIKDSDCITQFYWICYYNTTKLILKYCVENGADLTIKNIYGNTPFHWICHYNKDLIHACKPYMNEYDFIKTLKECEINWKEYV